VSPNLLLNHTRPPFNDVRVRRAVDLAIDRAGYIKAVTQGSAGQDRSATPRSPADIPPGPSVTDSIIRSHHCRPC